MSAKNICTDPTCGCMDPVETDPFAMLRFLSARFKMAGVSEAVAESYARDIDLILEKYKDHTED